VAVAMRDGAAAGLAIIDRLLDAGVLGGYHFAHSARADLCRRLRRIEEARASYARALELVKQEPERRFLERRLAELATHPSADQRINASPARPDLS
jgi:RNA polymerase sigma-70 factor (ECF subfamily)